MSRINEARASRSCSTCRSRKRKCTREIPKCSLCSRYDKVCDYSEGLSGSQLSYPPKEVTAPTNRTIAASRSQEGNGISPSYTESSTDQHLISLHRHQSAAPSLTFPSLFFLDSPAFEYGKYTIEKPLIVLPDEYLCHLGDSAETQNSMNRFFATVHTWLPIVSKLQFSQQQLELPNQGDAETELILMVMELLNQTLGERPSSQIELYRSIKLCYSYLEMHNAFSIRLLQAAVLIALYEVANAMYPVAYLTVGHCARLGHAIGLHRQRQAPQMLPTPDTWREAEERRRVWWAIIILDRYVNIGNRHHPFASEDAMPGDFLPVDDQSWDQGELTVNQPLVVSTSASIHAFPFARACQSAHLLSRVIRHMNETEMDPEFRFQEALQLHRTVQALALALRNESQELATNESHLGARQLFTAVALVHSARLHLYNMYSCIDVSDVRGASSAERLEMQKIAITGLEDVSAEVLGFAKTIRQAIELEGLSKVSPLVVECLYQAAANYAWYIRESQKNKYVGMLHEIKETLRLMGYKWGAASEFAYAVLRSNSMLLYTVPSKYR